MQGITDIPVREKNNMLNSSRSKVKMFQADEKLALHNSKVGLQLNTKADLGLGQGSQKDGNMVTSPKNYTTISPDIQARVAAFRNKREALKTPTDSVVECNENGNENDCSSSKMLNFKPNRAAPKKPKTIMKKKEIVIVDDNVSSVQSTQSLSVRRGMSLPLEKLGLAVLKNGNEKKSGSLKQNNFTSTPILTPTSVGSSINATSITSTSSEISTVRFNKWPLDASSAFTSITPTNEDLFESVNPKDINNTSNTTTKNSKGLFDNFSSFVDIDTGSLNFAGKLSLSPHGIQFNNNSSSKLSIDDFELLEELGTGNYGKVYKVLHKNTNVIMAMKMVRLELDESKFNQILMELEVLHKCNSPYVVDFYGAFFVEGSVYMCMEYMDGGSLDKILHNNNDGNGVTNSSAGIDEPHLARMAESVIKGLMELKDSHNIIHRDVKPTNILCSATYGTIKLCDFGVSGNLVASLAKTNIGCQSYMAPERINLSSQSSSTYSVQSDIWSLGISMVELAIGSYPYPLDKYDNIFSQLSAIIDDPSPKLPSGRFSKEAQEFIALCLEKNPNDRPTYMELLQHPWILKYKYESVQMNKYISERLENKKEND